MKLSLPGQPLVVDHINEVIVRFINGFSPFQKGSEVVLVRQFIQLFLLHHTVQKTFRVIIFTLLLALTIVMHKVFSHLLYFLFHINITYHIISINTIIVINTTFLLNQRVYISLSLLFVSSYLLVISNYLLVIPHYILIISNRNLFFLHNLASFPSLLHLLQLSISFKHFFFLILNL